MVFLQTWSFTRRRMWSSSQRLWRGIFHDWHDWLQRTSKPVQSYGNWKSLPHQKDLPFTSLVTLDMRDWSPRFIDNISKKKKVQSVLVNHKPKVSTFMKEKWERERLERRAEAKTHSEQYKSWLMTDTDFAKHVKEKRKTENERQKRGRLIGSRSSRMMKISNFFLRTSLVKNMQGEVSHCLHAHWWRVFFIWMLNIEEGQLIWDLYHTKQLPDRHPGSYLRPSAGV